MTATGKSRIGLLVAELLDRDFYDCDHVIEKKTGVSIGTIFADAGEDAFRKLESDVLKELANLNDVVISTGGGAVLRGVNRVLLKSRGTVVHLRSDIAELVKRTQHNSTRPLLAGDPAQKLQQMWESRMPLYNGVADQTFVSSDIKSTRLLAQSIVDWYRTHETK